MIAIVNIGPHTDDPGGERTYEVRINRKLITTFKHHRKDGLSVCLSKASKAVAESRKVELLSYDFIDVFSD